MNYTKGEWVADIRVGVVTVHVKDPERFNCLDGLRNECLYWANGKAIEVDGKFNHWDVSPEQVDTSRLIAAAPDMYEALKTILDTSQKHSIWTGLEMAKAALAKAEGK